MEIFGQTDIGRARRANQDAFGARLYGDTAVAVVCDGMGGANAGEVASGIAVESFLADMDARFSPDAAAARWAREDALAEAVMRADAAVCERAETDADCRGMGTTLVAAIVSGGRAVVANIGDSRAYHISDGGALRVTRDHSVVEDMVERGEITNEQARRHPNRNLITRALGAAPGAPPDVFSVVLKSGDYLVLCSDGLSNLLSCGELRDEARRGGELSELCGRLIDAALRRGAPDNVTVVTIRA
ncbi:MAG: Stp1/IreP family PP2C-type Ser/Thr phosphatase [Oscillospiraceae bacterium]|jgi:protein phosphatase|nr:Stp1/IreP family PP2C-type Ser/Thr phosphatase [Oscillospiraceae bacterium]